MDIKCAACGHTEIDSYDFDTQKDEWHFLEFPHEYVHEGKEFIEIDGSFTMTDDSYYPSLKKVHLYACPICGTVKMIKD